MARYFSGGTKNYTLRGGVYEEDGDGIGTGVGTASSWLNDGERNSTFEIGDAVNPIAVFIGSISVNLVSGGSIDLPVFQNKNFPSLVWISPNKIPTDPDFQFPDTIDINALDKSPFQALKGPTRFNDDFKGIAGAERVDLAEGHDIFRALGGGDTVNGGIGNDTIFGQRGKDFLSGDNGNDRLFGGAGNDFLSGDNGKDTLNGGNGNDNLFGDAGADTLRGGKGADDLTGGAGWDTLIGGNGADDFNFSTSNGSKTLGRDTILDFNPNVDDLFLFVADADAVTVTATRAKTVIVHEGGRIILDGIKLTDDQIDDLVIL